MTSRWLGITLAAAALGACQTHQPPPPAQPPPGDPAKPALMLSADGLGSIHADTPWGEAPLQAVFPKATLRQEPWTEKGRRLGDEIIVEQGGKPIVVERRRGTSSAIHAIELVSDAVPGPDRTHVGMTVGAMRAHGALICHPAPEPGVVLCTRGAQRSLVFQATGPAAGTAGELPSPSVLATYRVQVITWLPGAQ